MKRLFCELETDSGDTISVEADSNGVVMMVGNDVVCIDPATSSQLAESLNAASWHTKFGA